MRRVKWFTTVAVAITLVGTGAAGASVEARPDGSTTLAVIGDTPYDDAELARFPSLVADVNADPSVSAVLHLGDIKSGQPCTDEFFVGRRTLYDTFDDPFVYTPGDNEWTDCSRPQFGGYTPTERLDSLRRIFYPNPWLALGGRPPLVLRPQSRDRAYAEFVENRMWTQSRTVFSTLHVVGSDNDLEPWFDGAETPGQRALRLAEFERRLAADLDWLDRTFEMARLTRARGVVVAMQANVFVSRLFPGAAVDGFRALVQRLADLSRGFGGPVLLLQGDTHRYFVDHPLSSGSPEHGVTTRAPNVTRVVVEGTPATEWLRLRVDPRSPELFSWERRTLTAA